MLHFYTQLLQRNVKVNQFSIIIISADQPDQEDVASKNVLKN